jgi:hypothetical protein
VTPRSDSSIRYFAVTSHGVSATRWLAFVLASHPKVFVAHGHFSVDSIVGGGFQQERAKDDAAALSMGNAARELYDSKGIADVFAAYRRVKPDAAAYGNVHSYTLQILKQQLAASGDIPGFAIANLVRHPVSYIESHVSLVHKAERYPEVYESYSSDLFPKALQEYRELFLADCPDFREFLAFAVSCYSALNVARDLGEDGYRHFRMETLTADASVLGDFCKSLTGFDYDPQQLGSFVAAGAINRHRKGASSTDPVAIYGAWPAWKRDIAAMMISAPALKRFEGAGYDVDMLRLGSRATERERIAAPCLADALRAMDEHHPLLAPLRTAVKTADGPSYSTEPRFVESLSGYNILQVGSRFVVISQDLGEVDVTADMETLVERHGAERMGEANTLGEARARARTLAVSHPAAPRLVESMAGYNIVEFGLEFYAVKQSVGAVDVSSGAQALIARYGDKGVIVAPALDDVRDKVQAAAMAKEP